MIKRTSISLDETLLTEARAVLGTKSAADTVRQALEEVVRRHRLRRLAAEPFEDLRLELRREMSKTGFRTGTSG